MNPWRSIRSIKGLLALLGILLVLASLWLPILPFRVTDKEEAARMIASWVLSDQVIAGVTDSYPDSELVASKQRIFVVCDFVPTEFRLSRDARVHRVTESEAKALYQEFGFAGCDYLTIRLQEEGKSRLRIEVSNWLGGQAGHGYLFTLRRNAFGLTATAELQWIS